MHTAWFTTVVGGKVVGGKPCRAGLNVNCDTQPDQQTEPMCVYSSLNCGLVFA